MKPADAPMRIRMYDEKTMPPAMKAQVRAFLSKQWPERWNKGKKKPEQIIRSQLHPVHIILSQKGEVISYAGVVWRDITHAHQTFKTYGLSGVFTHQKWRNQGHGSTIVREATAYIRKQDGDIVLLCTRHKRLYERAGFIQVKNASVLGKKNEHIFMLFLSKKGKEARRDFETVPINVGKTMW